MEWRSMISSPFPLLQFFTRHKTEFRFGYPSHHLTSHLLDHLASQNPEYPNTAAQRNVAWLCSRVKKNHIQIYILYRLECISLETISFCQHNICLVNSISSHSSTSSSSSLEFASFSKPPPKTLQFYFPSIPHQPHSPLLQQHVPKSSG